MFCALCPQYNLGIEGDCAFGVPGGWKTAKEMGFGPHSKPHGVTYADEALAAAGGAKAGAESRRLGKFAAV